MGGSDERTASLFGNVGIEGRPRSWTILCASLGSDGRDAGGDGGELVALHSGIGRRSIAPQMRLRAMLLQALAG